MIIPVYKPLGASSHQLAQKVGTVYGEKATHTGTLDPMAEGVLIVLTGEDRFAKQKYSDTQKIYEFEILIGFTTDSHDLLGLITSQNTDGENKTFLKEHIIKALEEIKSNPQQIIPTFSAKRQGGKSGFDLGRAGLDLPKIEEPISIYELDLIDQRMIDKESLIKVIIMKLQTVSGDFRQMEITDQWKSVFNGLKQEHFTILKCRGATSKRTYIRGIVRDLSELINVSCTTFSITRVQNGQYAIEDCICTI